MSSLNELSSVIATCIICKNPIAYINENNIIEFKFCSPNEIHKCKKCKKNK